MRLEFDVIIIGAGPAGSTAAILLARAGWSVVLVEKQSFPRRKVCGECIAASNLPLIDALGLGEQFIASAGPELRRVAFMQGEDTVVADLPALDHEKYAWGRALGRETLDTLLLGQARAAGTCVLQPWSLRTLNGSSGNFHCEVRSGDSRETSVLRAPVAISAQGSWEPVPATRTENRGVRPSDLLAFKANFSGATLDAGLLPVISFSGGYGGMVMAGHGLLTLACCIRADRLDSLRRAAPRITAGRVVGAMLRNECAGVETALDNARQLGPWLAAGPLRPGIHLRAHEEVYRIGNAAGEAHPIIGEGMSMAMQSAWMLCGHLLRAGSPSAAANRAVLVSYTEDWRRFFTRRLRLAAVFAYIAMRPDFLTPPRILKRHLSPLLKYAAKLSGKVHSVVDPVSVAALASGIAIDPRGCS